MEKELLLYSYYIALSTCTACWFAQLLLQKKVAQPGRQAASQPGKLVSLSFS